MFTISGAASHSALVLSLSHSALRAVPLDILQDAGPVWTPLWGWGGLLQFVSDFSKGDSVADLVQFSSLGGHVRASVTGTGVLYSLWQGGEGGRA